MASSKQQVELAIAEHDVQPGFQCLKVPAVRPQPSLAADLAAGFAGRPRSLPAKYFYDGYGSELFDRICDTPEYYPMRVESSLLARHAGEVIASVRPDHIIELGSGASRKTRYLLDACAELSCGAHYWPFDVCEEMLTEAGQALRQRYPQLGVTALVGDYLAGLENLPQPGGNRLFVFLGGTLGNFEQAQAHAFMRELRGRLRPGDALLLGVDRVKEPAVLHAAYNDAAGVTAEFNLNVLRVVNRELGADFDLDGFRHQAVYNQAGERIEMYLVSERAQRVSVPALQAEYVFAAGEPILTEISQKYSDARLAELLAATGLRQREHYLPEDGAFSLLLLERAD